MSLRLASQLITTHSIILLLIGLHGSIKHVAAGWTKYQTNSKACGISPDPCCLPVLTLDGFAYLDVPDGAFITGQLSTGPLESKVYFDAAVNQVTVKHYTNANEPLKDYFTMHRERLGTYYDPIHWKGDEIARFGQKLAVCVIQKEKVADQTIFRLEAFVDVWT